MYITKPTLVALLRTALRTVVLSVFLSLRVLSALTFMTLLARTL